MLEVIRTGPLATVQDMGRPGFAHLGISRSGAADRDSLRLANRLVGNAETAAGVEITLGGFAARFTVRATIALAGAPCPVTVDGRGGHMYGPVEVRAGEQVRFGPPAAGLRTYLAVRGGIDVAPLFGSRATDLLGGIGPQPLATGTRLPIGTDTDGWPAVEVAPVPPIPDVVRLPITPGPRADWLADGALGVLTSVDWTVTMDSNRVGLRLAGRALAHASARELPTEGMVEGAVQVPASGQPVLLLADHGVTGGYPVIAVVRAAALGAAAQTRPGDRIRFAFDRMRQN